MRLGRFIGLFILLASCNAFPRKKNVKEDGQGPEKGSHEEQTKLSKLAGLENLMKNPLNNLNKAIGLEGAMKGIISGLHGTENFPWKNPLTHPELRSKNTD